MHTWFTSDFHLGHANIIRYCNRPFKSLEEMNQTIIDNCNAKIKDDDLVYFLGDFCFKNSRGGKPGEGDLPKAAFYQKQFKGKWIYLKGNHDRNNSLKAQIDRLVIEFGGHRINLVHNPQFANSKYSLNLVGHIHEKWLIKRLSDTSLMYNVGVDVHKFGPIDFDDIQRDLSKWKRSNP